MENQYCVGAPSSAGREEVAFADDEDLARALKALGHPARLSLIRLLSKRDACSGTEVFSLLDLAQSTVSEHLRVLGEAGLLCATPAGNRTCYCLVPGRLGALSEAVATLLYEKPDRITTTGEEA